MFTILAVSHLQQLSGNKIMMKNIQLFFSIGALFMTVLGNAQSTIKPLKIAVFAPVYLDSAFDRDNYKLGNNNLPKYILPGLDFYNGMALAIDSLNAENQPLEILFYDTKSIDEPIETILNKPELQDISLLIASFNIRNEIKPLADFSLKKNIPLLSMTYPNDGGVTNNPFFVMVNPTIITHIDAIYTYLHRNYPTENITVFKRKGATEDLILNRIETLNKKTLGIPLKLNIVELIDSFTTKEVMMQLDSTKQNIILCGSLNESFGLNLVNILAANKNYKSIIMGMPTWDGLKDIGKNAEIIYTSSYNYSRTDKLAQTITKNYKNKYQGRPSDMAFKGFEAVYHFSKLLIKYNKNLINHLSDKEWKLFNEYDFQAVKDNNHSTVPDYIENKRVYFIRKVDRQIKFIK